MNETLELTKHLVRLESVTGNIRPDVVATIANTLQEQGYKTQQVPTASGTHFYATAGQGPVHLAFVSHYDVVPAGEGWNTTPFDPVMRDGILYGRGVCDMKGGLAAQILAGKYLASQGMKISLYIAADEENQSEGMPVMLGSLTEKIDYALCGEPTSFHKSGDAIKVGRRGVLQGKIVLHGTGGHAAYATQIDNPIHALGKVIENLTVPCTDARFDFPASSLSITNINGGTGSYNQVPNQVSLLFDARLSPKTSSEAFETSLRERLDAQHKDKYVLTITKRTPVYHTSDPSFRQIVCGAIKDIVGVLPQINCLGGMSDARFFAWKKIPTLEVGLPAGNMHGPNEFVKIEELERLQRVYEEIGRRLL